MGVGRQIHQPSSHPSEKTSLLWLGKEIPKHLISRAVFDTKLSSFHSVGDEEIPDVNVMRTFATRGPSIPFQKQCRSALHLNFVNVRENTVSWYRMNEGVVVVPR